MKREKKLTKRERKAEKGVSPSGKSSDEKHIHCIACGRHIDPAELTEPPTATFVFCEHKSRFPSCVRCVPKTRELLAEHDRTGQPVKMAGAWH